MQTMKTIKGWHFVGKTLRDGSPIPKNGKWLKHTGPLRMCESGLHASLTPWDAFQYAPGNTICYVECRGDIVTDPDKFMCRERKIITRMDATELLRYFARMQALSVVHLWDAPDVVLDYLMTGDEFLREAAREAAQEAVRKAVRKAAWAAWAAGAAREAAREAAQEATQAAARKAAWAARAAQAAAWAAARAARDDFNNLVYECFKGSL